VGDDVGLVFNDPLDGLTFLELHRFGNGGGEVDVILVGAFLAPDELDFRWVSHGCGLL
jgi:hypothetical protein